MNLLENWVVWVSAVTMILVLILAAFITTRTTRKWYGWALNLLIITLSSALTLVSTFLIVNRYNGWYPTTADIFATGTEITEIPSAPSSSFKLKDSSKPQLSVTTLPPLPAPGERIQHFIVPSSVGKKGWDVTVVLPLDYQTPSATPHHYPVLFAGHGVPGSPQQWLGPMDIRPYLDAAVTNKQLAASIVVIPTITPDGMDTECIYGPAGLTQIETWLAKDIPTFLKSHLRVRTDRGSWAWVGFSAGAWCGTMLTMRHPNVWAATISLGGYFKPWPTSKIASSHKELINTYDLINQAKTNPPPVAVWAQTNQNDRSSSPQTVALAKAAKEPMHVTVTMNKSGGHTTMSWKPYLKPALIWLGNTLPGFHPTH